MRSRPTLPSSIHAMSDLSSSNRVAQSRSSTDSARSIGHRWQSYENKGKAKAQDDLSESDDLGIACSSAVSSTSHSPSKGKQRQTEPITSHSSPMLTLPDMGDNFELHVKSQFLHLDSDGPSTSGREKYGYHPRSAHRNDLVLCRSTNKRSFKESTSSPSSSPISVTLEPARDSMQQRQEPARLQSVAMAREPMHALPNAYCKKRRANGLTEHADAASTSRHSLFPDRHALPNSSSASPSEPSSFRHRSSLLSNSSTSDLGFHPYPIPCDSLAAHSRSPQPSSDTADALFAIRRRQLERQARQESNHSTIRRYLNEVAAEHTDATSTEALGTLHDDSRSSLPSSRNRHMRNSRFEARPLLLPSLIPSSHDPHDNSTATAIPSRLDPLRLDTIDGESLSTNPFDSWSRSQDMYRRPQESSDLVVLASRTRSDPEQSGLEMSHPEQAPYRTSNHATRPRTFSHLLANWGETTNMSRTDTIRHDPQSDQSSIDTRAGQLRLPLFPRRESSSVRLQDRQRTAHVRTPDFSDDEDRPLLSALSQHMRERRRHLSTASALEEQRLQRARFGSLESSLDPDSQTTDTEDNRPLSIDRMLTRRRVWAENGRGTLGLRDLPASDSSSNTAGEGRSLDRPLRLSAEADMSTGERPRQPLPAEGLTVRREAHRALYRPPTLPSRRSQDETALNFLRRVMSEDSQLEGEDMDEMEAASLRMATRREARSFYPFLPSTLPRPSTSDTPGDRIALDPRNFVADDDWSGFDTFEGLMRLADEIGHAETRVPQSLLNTLPTCEYGKWDGGSCKLVDRCPTPPDKGKGKQKVTASQRDLMCPICREDYLDPDLLMSVPNCHHAFHAECLTTWFKNAKTCPLCRSDVFEHRSSMHRL